MLALFEQESRCERAKFCPSARVAVGARNVHRKRLASRAGERCMMPLMSRATHFRNLVPFAVISLLMACSSGPKPVPETAADKNETADSPADEDSDSGSSKKADAAEVTDEKKSDDKSEDKKAKDEDAPPVDDSRTTASVAKIFKDNRKAFKKCYEDVRKEKPELKGNVLLKVVLDGDGQVKKAYVDDESSIREQKVIDCMIKVAKGLTYPKSSKGLEKDFEYDFGFNNQTK